MKSDLKKVILKNRNLDSFVSEKKMKRVLKAVRNEHINPEMKVLNLNLRGLKLAKVVLLGKTSVRV